MTGRLFTFATLLALAAPAAAADLSVSVVDGSGRPVRDAVVSLATLGQAGRPAAPGRFTVSQQNLTFHPFVLVVPAGSTVAFPNLDSTRHHVYSFSTAKRFELKLFARDQSRSVLFDRPGIVALGCNIHDSMSAFIYVAPNSWVARTDGRGVATIANVPGGASRLTVWHPFLRAPGGSVISQVLAGQRSAQVSVKLRPPPMRMNQAY